ncbi:MAG: hypothetical protein H6Q10_1848 [Acidobacteria bacterium]|nr:hypothetical protein [Acidobacteriota bacterium]
MHGVDLLLTVRLHHLFKRQQAPHGYALGNISNTLVRVGIGGMFRF